MNKKTKDIAGHHAGHRAGHRAGHQAGESKAGGCKPEAEGSAMGAASRAGESKGSAMGAVPCTVEEAKAALLDYLVHGLGHDPELASKRDWWLAACGAMNYHLRERWIQTVKAHRKGKVRRLYYLSMEYLMGRLLENNAVNMGLFEVFEKAFEDLGLDFRCLLEEESDMGLGNGGLGRLAACFLDSLASLEYPAVGYGIHYEFGLFEQVFKEHQQRELPEAWLRFGNPWHLRRPEYVTQVALYGKLSGGGGRLEQEQRSWASVDSVVGVPWDVPVVGYGAKTINFLRLWESRSAQDLDLDRFQQGDYVEAVREKAVAETISKVLYPNDATQHGKELRLIQQYFFVSCSLQDILRRYKAEHQGFGHFCAKVSVQLNDTHPSLAVPELLRLLMDVEGLSWEQSWEFCRKVFAYTNHTLLPEALETWSVMLLRKVLPRHLDIIEGIDARELQNPLATKPELYAKLSLFEKPMGSVPDSKNRVRMAHLAILASHSVNGVAKLHTHLLKTRVFPEFDAMFPGKFQNKTNGVSQRRFLKVCNPKLASLLDATLGQSWATELSSLEGLRAYAEDKNFQEQFAAVKQANKKRLAKVLLDVCGLRVSPSALFDVQMKRLHEYKRQHLKLLHILSCYRAVLDGCYAGSPRVFIFGAKAAPGYALAKDIIHVINAVAATINADARLSGQIKVAFLPNYRLSLAEVMLPAADLSEQISAAGSEASGTGNMKLALNGALTIGTMDGANVEMAEAIGEEHMFIFGMKAEQLEALKAEGYRPKDYIEASPELQSHLNWLVSGEFGKAETLQAAERLRANLMQHDPFCVCADFEDYCRVQGEVDALAKTPSLWTQKAILNTAAMGYFSSDRAIDEYARAIWKLEPSPVC